MRIALLLCAMASTGALAGDWVLLPGDDAFDSVLDYEDTDGTVVVAPFQMMAQPVTNAQFHAFVTRGPQWRRDGVPVIFAEARYLGHWSGPSTLGEKALLQQPVTHVSWFAAQAYCDSMMARLPTWSEWEYAAAADETRNDARKDSRWRDRILGWYSKPSNTPLQPVRQGPPNIYGLYDLHGLVWEWVEDYAAMLVSADNRQQADPDVLTFCGAGALSTDDREDYAVLMRIAMLSALEADDTTGNLGFRCARNADSRL